MKLTVTHPHIPDPAAPLELAEGDIIWLGPQDDLSPSWYWCTDKMGHAQWVPAQVFERNGEKATLTRAYSSRELQTHVGDALEGLEQIDDWWLCENAAGQWGWVPEGGLKKI